MKLPKVVFTVILLTQITGCTVLGFIADVNYCEHQRDKGWIPDDEVCELPLTALGLAADITIIKEISTSDRVIMEDRTRAQRNSVSERHNNVYVIRH